MTKPLRWLLLRSPAEGALAAVAAGLREGGAVEGGAGLYMDGETVLEQLPTSRAEQAGLALAVVEWAADTCTVNT